jgi:hypothetical protein
MHDECNSRLEDLPFTVLSSGGQSPALRAMLNYQASDLQILTCENGG